MKKVYSLIITFISIIFLISCSPSETIKNNIAKDAENFSVYRKATVINLISDTILLEVEGYFSMETSPKTGAMAIVVRTAPKQYKMHYIYIDKTIHVITIVEQLDNTNTDPYHWKIRIYAILPEFEGGPEA